MKICIGKSESYGERVRCGMEKIKKFAVNVDRVAKVAAIIYFIAGVCAGIACFVVIIAALFDRDVFLQLDEYSRISLGYVKLQPQLEYAAAYRTSGDASIIRLIVSTLSLAVLCFLFYFMAKVVRKIVQPMKEAQPFEESVHKNLKKLGVFILLQGVVWELAKMYTEFIQYHEYQIASLFDSRKIASCTLDFRFDLTFLVAALVVFGLSYIFQYGTELQKFSDETV